MTSPTPARVSGPGALSQRTDNGQPIRNLPDAKYGENRDLVALQKAAPMADGPDRPLTAPVSPMPAAGPSGPPVTGPPPELIGAGAPTTRPGEPVTSGVALGPGPGPVQRQQPQLEAGQLSNALAPYFAADDTGVLADLAWRLSEMGL